MLAKAPKVGRAQLLRMEADVAELEEAFDELKRQRPRCESCGRLKVTGGRSKLDKEIRKAAGVLYEKRQAWRQARAVAPVVVEE